MPPVDVEALKAEDEEEARTGVKSLRYAASMKVDLSPDSAGTWERLGADTMLWRLRVHSDGARSLNFGFDQYFMPRWPPVHLLAGRQALLRALHVRGQRDA
jgi:hypothetical protein